MAFLRELCQRPQPEWESRCKINAGEDLEKGEAALIVDGNVSWSRKSVWSFLWLLNDNLWPGRPIPGYILHPTMETPGHVCSLLLSSQSMPINWRPNKRGMVNIYIRIQLGTRERLEQDLQENGQNWETFYISQGNPGLRKASDLSSLLRGSCSGPLDSCV